MRAMTDTGRLTTLVVLPASCGPQLMGTASLDISPADAARTALPILQWQAENWHLVCIGKKGSKIPLRGVVPAFGRDDEDLATFVFVDLIREVFGLAKKEFGCDSTFPGNASWVRVTAVFNGNIERSLSVLSDGSDVAQAVHLEQQTLLKRYRDHRFRFDGFVQP
jgi:hypothetical protein